MCFKKGGSEKKTPKISQKRKKEDVAHERKKKTIMEMKETGLWILS